MRINEALERYPIAFVATEIALLAIAGLVYAGSYLADRRGLDLAAAVPALFVVARLATLGAFAGLLWLAQATFRGPATVDAPPAR